MASTIVALLLLSSLKSRSAVLPNFDLSSMIIFCAFFFPRRGTAWKNPTSALTIALRISDRFPTLNIPIAVLQPTPDTPIRYSNNFKSVGFKTCNFENQSIIFYWKKILGLPIPVARLYKHNHWGGAGCFVSPKSIIKFLEKKGVKVSAIQFDVEGQKMMWITGQK